MNKKVIIMIVILIAVIGAGIFGIYYDRDEALLERTQPIPLGDGVEIVEMHKHGFIFHRSSYEAKISISHDHPELVVDYLTSLYNFEGDFMMYPDYVVFSKDIFDGTNIMQPTVEDGTNVWVQGVGEENGGASVVNIIVSEDSSHAYLYVYYHA